MARKASERSPGPHRRQPDAARPPLHHRSYSTAVAGSKTRSRRDDMLYSTTVESLDLPLPPSLQLACILDGSIARALVRLKRLHAQVVELSSESELSDVDEEDDADLEEYEDMTIKETFEVRHSSLGQALAAEPVGRLNQPAIENVRRAAPSLGAEAAEQRQAAAVQSGDVEALAAFLRYAYDTLKAIREDVQSQLPDLPGLPSVEELRLKFQDTCSTAAEDTAAVTTRLSEHYHRVNKLLSQLTLCTASVLPDLPSLPFSPLVAARASLSAYCTEAGRRRVSISQVAETSSQSREHSDATIAESTKSTPIDLPSPPLSAIRTFLASESARLSSRLPSRPDFEGWAEGLSHALQDASHYVHDEGEKIVDFVVDEAERLAHALSTGAQRLLHYHELPTEWRNNKYILSGYRFIPIDRPSELLLSGLQWHNETVNIYTHLIPAIYIPLYIYFVFPTTTLGDPAYNTFVDRAISLTFLLASEACLLLSAAWHLAAGCGTFSFFHRCATLDYLGISSLISSSILTLTHQGFRCAPRLDLVYNTTTCLFGALGLYLPWKAWFNKRQNKNIRIVFFLLLSGAGIAPMVHMALLYGTGETWRFYSPVLFSVLAYLIGLVFYAFDFPEVMRPGGLFDTLFHSHQFWHCGIVAAIALHWWALSTMSEKGLASFSCSASGVDVLSRATMLIGVRDEL